MRGTPRATFLTVLLCLFLSVSYPASALENGIGILPAMGWSSWNSFRCNISEAIIKASHFPRSNNSSSLEKETCIAYVVYICRCLLHAHDLFAIYCQLQVPVISATPLQHEIVSLHEGERGSLVTEVANSHPRSLMDYGHAGGGGCDCEQRAPGRRLYLD